MFRTGNFSLRRGPWVSLIFLFYWSLLGFFKLLRVRRFLESDTLILKGHSPTSGRSWNNVSQSWGFRVFCIIADFILAPPAYFQALAHVFFSANCCCRGLERSGFRCPQLALCHGPFCSAPDKPLEAGLIEVSKPLYYGPKNSAPILFLYNDLPLHHNHRTTTGIPK